MSASRSASLARSLEENELLELEILDEISIQLSEGDELLLDEDDGERSVSKMPTAHISPIPIHHRVSPVAPPLPAAATPKMISLKEEIKSQRKEFAQKKKRKRKQRKNKMARNVTLKLQGERTVEFENVLTSHTSDDAMEGYFLKNKRLHYRRPYTQGISVISSQVVPLHDDTKDSSDLYTSHFLTVPSHRTDFPSYNNRDISTTSPYRDFSVIPPPPSLTTTRDVPVVSSHAKTSPTIHHIDANKDGGRIDTHYATPQLNHSGIRHIGVNKEGRTDTTPQLNHSGIRHIGVNKESRTDTTPQLNHIGSYTINHFYKAINASNIIRGSPAKTPVTAKSYVDKKDSNVDMRYTINPPSKHNSTAYNPFKTVNASKTCDVSVSSSVTMATPLFNRSQWTEKSSANSLFSRNRLINTTPKFDLGHLKCA